MEYLTLEQAAETWEISWKTIMKYVSEGVLAGITIDNNYIMFPKINKPHYIGRKKVNIHKEIIKAVKSKEYFDYLLANMGKAEFSATIQQLINKDYLINFGNNDGFTTNIGISVGVNADDLLKKSPNALKKILNLNINVENNVTLNNDFTVNNQMGLLNVGG